VGSLELAASISTELDRAGAIRTLSKARAAQGLAVVTGLFWLFLIEVMPPRLGEYLWYLILGLPLGFGYGFWRHKNVQHKNENIDKARARHATCSETRCCITAGVTARLLTLLLPTRRQYFRLGWLLSKPAQAAR